MPEIIDRRRIYGIVVVHQNVVSVLIADPDPVRRHDQAEERNSVIDRTYLVCLAAGDHHLRDLMIRAFRGSRDPVVGPILRSDGDLDARNERHIPTGERRRIRRVRSDVQDNPPRSVARALHFDIFSVECFDPGIPSVKRHIVDRRRIDRDGMSLQQANDPVLRRLGRFRAVLVPLLDRKREHAAEIRLELVALITRFREGDLEDHAARRRIQRIRIRCAVRIIVCHDQIVLEQHRPFLRNGDDRGIDRVVARGNISVPKDLRAVLRMEIPFSRIQMIGSVPDRVEPIRKRFARRRIVLRMSVLVLQSDIDLSDPFAVACRTGELVVYREVALPRLRHHKRDVRLLLLFGIGDQLVGDVSARLRLDIPFQEERSGRNVGMQRNGLSACILRDLGLFLDARFPVDLRDHRDRLFSAQQLDLVHGRLAVAVIPSCVGADIVACERFAFVERKIDPTAEELPIAAVQGIIDRFAVKLRHVEDQALLTLEIHNGGGVDLFQMCTLLVGNRIERAGSVDMIGQRDLVFPVALVEYLAVIEAVRGALPCDIHLRIVV